MGFTRPWWGIFSFNTIEKKSDLVTWTNHYIYVRVNDLANSYAVDDSKDRYKWLTNEALDVYGTNNLEIGAILMVAYILRTTDIMMIQTDL
ncbi:MAG: hypothetical protein ACTSRD_00585 [Promethearchaeota archaeon]